MKKVQCYYCDEVFNESDLRSDSFWFPEECNEYFSDEVCPECGEPDCLPPLIDEDIITSFEEDEVIITGFDLGEGESETGEVIVTKNGDSFIVNKK